MSARRGDRVRGRISEVGIRGAPLRSPCPEQRHAHHGSNPPNGGCRRWDLRAWLGQRSRSPPSPAATAWPVTRRPAPPTRSELPRRPRSRCGEEAPRPGRCGLPARSRLPPRTHSLPIAHHQRARRPRAQGPGDHGSRMSPRSYVIARNRAPSHRAWSHSWRELAPTHPRGAIDARPSATEIPVHRLSKQIGESS